MTLLVGRKNEVCARQDVVSFDEACLGKVLACSRHSSITALHPDTCSTEYCWWDLFLSILLMEPAFAMHEQTPQLRQTAFFCTDECVTTTYTLLSCTYMPSVYIVIDNTVARLWHHNTHTVCDHVTLPPECSLQYAAHCSPSSVLHMDFSSSTSLVVS